MPLPTNQNHLIETAVDAYTNGATMNAAARLAGMPWQRLLFILRDRGVLRPNAHNEGFRNRQPRRSPGTATGTPTRTRRPRRGHTYGIEIECMLPMGTCRVGTYRIGIQIPDLPEGWVAKSDGSIRNCPQGYEGLEVVSPILSSADGVEQILTVCKWLQDHNAKVNPSTGLHVHIGWRGTAEQLRKLIRLTAKNERGLYAATGTKNRESNEYCQPIANRADYRQVDETGQVRYMSRRHSLNLTNLRRGGKHTVEYRLFAGTTNATKILAYVRLCLGLVEKAMDPATEMPAWNYDNERAVERLTTPGSKHLENLLDELGWTNGHTFGAIHHDAAPAPIALAFELGRLAAKYDGNLTTNDAQ